MLNSISYAYHYRNLDSVKAYAKAAYVHSELYGSGRAEALNNLAFVSIMRMDYSTAIKMIDEAVGCTDNQIELLVSDILRMQICLRKSENRSFYDYRQSAIGRMKRIKEEQDYLDERSRKRMLYAETEYAFISSAYYHYVGLDSLSSKSMAGIDSHGEIRKDTAQYLNYLYYSGVAGLLNGEISEATLQQKFWSLVACYFIAKRHGYIYFMAKSLEAMSRICVNPQYEEMFIAADRYTFEKMNLDSTDNEPLVERFAKSSLLLFEDYGDVYQIAEAYRTMASCYVYLGDFQSALLYLNMSQADNKIQQSPSLVASICEQLCIVYSCLNDKQASDYNRNIYLDLQEKTRQDRYMESRADMLQHAVSQLNKMIVSVFAAIVLLILSLLLFHIMSRKSSRSEKIEILLKPLEEWQMRCSSRMDKLREALDTLEEKCVTARYRRKELRLRNLEHRVKLSFVNDIMSFIDRIISELERLKKNDKDDRISGERFTYTLELVSKINEYNDVLTQWIKLRQGQVDLHIESFPLKPLFELISKSRTSFIMKGIELKVNDTELIVKADRVLTLFMINTLADNARKFTSAGGCVSIEAFCIGDLIEISISDTGCGIPQNRIRAIFDYKAHNGHGFGLMNCWGIMEKYRKISRAFRSCVIAAESEVGKGSRFYFRLPKGVVRNLIMTLFTLPCVNDGFCIERADSIIDKPALNSELSIAKSFADSAYFANVNGNYGMTVIYADSCLKHLNMHYFELNPNSHIYMSLCKNESSLPAEVKWYRDSIQTNYSIILDIRNETAIAALALHDLALYDYNNKIYVQLYKEMSIDNTLDDYCRGMQMSRANKTIAVIILLSVLIMILPAYYLVYYRHRLYYKFCIEQIRIINSLLLNDDSYSEKLEKMRPYINEKYPDKLHDVVYRIVQALSDVMSIEKKKKIDICNIEDELHRLEYETNRLYISNSVLDNCLSTLKHETMYYPNRIYKLLSDGEHNYDMLYEYIVYYREILSTLSLQAIMLLQNVKLHIEPIKVNDIVGMADAELCLLGDKEMIDFMFTTLYRESGNDNMSVYEVRAEKKYIYISLAIDGLNQKRVLNLFTPRIENIPYILCRQVVREHAEVTGRWRCGISAKYVCGKAIVEIIMPKYLVK